jgi:DNA-binding MurR/RpiR family transcriptional regulator
MILRPVSWEDRAMGAYASLRPSERKVAEFFLDHKDDVGAMNIREVAQSVGVSEPTVLRCVKGLGYKGYKAFKRAVQAGVPDRDSSFELMGGVTIRPWDSIRDLPLRAIGTHRASLDNLLKSLGTDRLEEAARIMSESRIIDIYCVENSATAATDLQVKLTYLGLCCRFCMDPYLQQISAVHLGRSDTAIAFTRSGSSIDTLRAMKLAHKSGARTIAVTASENAPVNRYSDITLLTGTDEQKVYGNAIFSRVNDVAVVDMIYMAVILSDYDRFSANLDRSGSVIADREVHEQK